MILIAHRGNTNGKSPRENRPDYIQNTLKADYDVEVDVWYLFGKLALGHDEPQYEIEEDFLKNPKVWCHAKTINTFKYLLDLNVTCFFHETDAVTLTSNGYIWTYPGKLLTEKSICVLPEDNFFIRNCAGICSDFVAKYK